MVEDGQRFTAIHAIAAGVPHANVDVVFIHGLNENWLTSWGFDRELSWREFLHEGAPHANIWSVDYRNSWTKAKGGSMTLFARAVNILETIAPLLTSDRPIILVGHSYGGLLIKELLRQAQQTRVDFFARVRGIVLMAVPNNGAGLAAYAKRAWFLMPSPAIADLTPNNPYLPQLTSWFSNEAGRQDWAMSVLVESVGLFPVGIVVDVHSSNPGVSGVTPVQVDGNHNSMIVLPDDTARQSNTRRDLRVTSLLAVINSVPPPQVVPLPADAVNPAPSVLPALIAKYRASGAAGDPQAEHVLSFLLGTKDAADALEWGRAKPKSQWTKVADSARGLVQAVPWQRLAADAAIVLICVIVLGGLIMNRTWADTPRAFNVPAGHPWAEMYADLQAFADADCPMFDWMCGSAFISRLVAGRDYRTQTHDDSRIGKITACEPFHYPPEGAESSPYEILAALGETFPNCVTVSIRQSSWDWEINSGLEETSDGYFCPCRSQ